MKKTKNTCKGKNSCKLSKFIEIFMTQGGRERAQHSQHGLLLWVTCEFCEPPSQAAYVLFHAGYIPSPRWVHSVPCWVHILFHAAHVRGEKDEEWVEMLRRRRHLPTFKVAIYLNQWIHVLSAFGIQTCNWHYCPITLTHLFLSILWNTKAERSQNRMPELNDPLTCWRGISFPAVRGLGLPRDTQLVTSHSPMFP